MWFRCGCRRDASLALAVSSWELPAGLVRRMSKRVPAEDFAGAVEGHEAGFQGWGGVFGDRLGGPAFGAVHDAGGAGRVEQDDLVHAGAEDLAGDILRGIG